MIKMKVWVVRFSDGLSDCDGVFSTEEKANAQFQSSYARCNDIWKNMELAQQGDNWKIYRFVCFNVERYCMIYETEIDLAA